MWINIPGCTYMYIVWILVHKTFATYLMSIAWDNLFGDAASMNLPKCGGKKFSNQ